MTAFSVRQAPVITPLRIDLAWELNLLAAFLALVFVGAVILGVF